MNEKFNQQKLDEIAEAGLEVYKENPARYKDILFIADYFAQLLNTPEAYNTLVEACKKKIDEYENKRQTQ